METQANSPLRAAELARLPSGGSSPGPDESAEQAFAVAFAGGPMLDSDELELDFDTALGRAIDDPNDQEAFRAISQQIEEARSSNDLNRLYAMAMNLGAMACLHDHLQSFSNELSASLFSSETGDHAHEHKDNPEDDDKKDKKKKEKPAKHAASFPLFLFRRRSS